MSISPPPPSPISVHSADHYTWGGGCDGWHLVRADALSVIQERMPPGTSEERHLHRAARQFFFVLRGTVTITIEGQEHVLSPFTGLEVPPGAPHEVRNGAGGEIAEFLVISQPPSHGDRHPMPLTP